MNKRIQKTIDVAIRRMHEKISLDTPDTTYGRALAREGFQGGYLAALNDVQLILVGAMPNQRNSEVWEP